MPGALIPQAGDDEYKLSLSCVNIDFAYPGAFMARGQSENSRSAPFKVASCFHGQVDPIERQQ